MFVLMLIPLACDSKMHCERRDCRRGESRRRHRRRGSGVEWQRLVTGFWVSRIVTGF
jgi:hypothetical protein